MDDLNRTHNNQILGRVKPRPCGRQAATRPMTARHWKVTLGLLVVMTGTISSLRSAPPLKTPRGSSMVTGSDNRRTADRTAVRRTQYEMISPDLPGTPPALPPAPPAPYEGSLRAQHVEPSLAWWEANDDQPQRRGTRPVLISLERLLVEAINHSAQIRVFGELPLIRETSITEADAAFDWTTFLNARWDDLSDPVGNSLTVGPGGGNRFNDKHLTGAAGLRRKTREGGKLEVAQELGWQTTNSTFFVPDPQGTGRLVLSYTHPVLRGSGKTYNESLVVLANIDTRVAYDEFSRQLQSHLLEVSRSYWSLYLERVNLAQKLRSYQRADATLKRLTKRVEIDAVKAQVVRAEAEVESRRSELVRAITAVKNAEARIRSLVNSPALGTFDTVELVPDVRIARQLLPVDMHGALQTAIQMRPEVAQALQQIKAACVRLEMSRNELMPVLNLITETYVAGLQADGRTIEAVGNQFAEGRPGYSVGLEFEVPLGNRAAEARHTRRHLEYRQLQSQYQTTIETLKLEVEVAVREVQTSFDEMRAKLRAMEASGLQLQYIEKRWELLPGEDLSTTLYLENLLDAQERLAAAEFDYANALITYNLSLINLKKATGELLQYEQVNFGRGELDHLPINIIDKTEVLHLEPEGQPAYRPDHVESELQHQMPPEPAPAAAASGGPSISRTSYVPGSSIRSLPPQWPGNRRDTSTSRREVPQWRP